MFWKKIENRIVKKFFREFDERDITMEELLKKQKMGAIIVDVRSSQEYKEGHLSNAINISEYEINSRMINVFKDKQKEIVVYCSSGQRSKKALKKLTKLGYNNVFNLYGGLDNWS